MIGYFSSDNLTENNRVQFEQISSLKLYYEVSFNELFKCYEAKQYLRNSLRTIIYYDINFSQELYQYHIQEYGKAIGILTYANFSENQKQTKVYRDGGLSEIYTYKYDDNKRVSNIIFQDEFYNLIEYRQCVYNESGKQISEKIFYADSWTIHEEDIE